MNEINIRKASLIDVSEICIIEKDCFSVPWSEESISESINNESWAFFVATFDDKIVGYGGVCLVIDEGQISNIAVLPSFRHQGIGSLLVETIISYCENKNAMFITLETRESNINAISLYEKYGFSIVGKRPNYYTNPTENAILMNKLLM